MQKNIHNNTDVKTYQIIFNFFIKNNIFYRIFFRYQDVVYAVNLY